MSKLKMITAETAVEFEVKVNEWIDSEKPSKTNIQFDADGMEFPYTAFIMYR